ncbi:MAG: glycine cleavage system protein H [Desulfobacterales bacterium]|jgi:glycine cleavage system H lipoate-binding protein|nr:glycine cleavage system protein H [Desulfobacterales bacterium]
MGSINQKENKFGDSAQCLWMQAGVVRKRYCCLDYNCPACRFDRMLRRVADQNQRLRQHGIEPLGRIGTIVGWREKLKTLPQTRQPCIHHLKGRIEFRPCTQAYRCSDCDFDQYFQDQFSVYADIRPVEVMAIEGIQVPQGYYLHQGHTWAKLEEGGAVRVGLDDFARRILGPLDQIMTPLMGQRVCQGAPAIRVQRGQLQAELVSPVSGVVTEINPGLRTKGTTAHAAPYTDGWVLRLHPDSLREEIKTLMIGSDTAAFYDQEVSRLYQVIEESVGPMATDGGYLGDDISGNLPQMDWQRVMRLLFRTR